MKSILQDIKQIRNNASFNIIQPLSNRYAVLCQEADTSKTAYCFSVPIRSIDTNDIIKPYFQHYKSESLFNGSSAKITIIDKVRFTSPDGECDLVFEGNLYKKTTDAIFYKNHCNVIEIRPTLNGLMVMTDYNATNAQIPLSLHLHKPFEAIRTNGKYFSVMKSKFIPFITVSCIGVMDDEERVIAPCELHYQEKSSLEYTLTFSSIYKSKACIAFEINMQETKLFQDTTVESKHPKQPLTLMDFVSSTLDVF